MARNEEKHVCRLNRFYLQQEKEEQLKKNPPRPKLHNLTTVEEIKQWLPSIKKDLDFNLKQSQVSCYPERKIKEFQKEIERLEREYRAFVRKLRDLDPDLKDVPWTERGYAGRKRQHDQVEGPANSDQSATKQNRTDIDLENFKRIETPLLEAEHQTEQSVLPVFNISTKTQDAPLQFRINSSETRSKKKKGMYDKDCTGSHSKLCKFNKRFEKLQNGTLPNEYEDRERICEGTCVSGSSVLSHSSLEKDFDKCDAVGNISTSDQQNDVTLQSSEVHKDKSNPLGIYYDSSSDSDDG